MESAPTPTPADGDSDLRLLRRQQSRHLVYGFVLNEPFCLCLKMLNVFLQSGHDAVFFCTEAVVGAGCGSEAPFLYDERAERDCAVGVAFLAISQLLV